MWKQTETFLYIYKCKKKIREGIDKLKIEVRVYEDALQQAEVMNKCF